IKRKVSQRGKFDVDAFGLQNRDIFLYRVPIERRRRANILEQPKPRHCAGLFIDHDEVRMMRGLQSKALQIRDEGAQLLARLYISIIEDYSARPDVGKKALGFFIKRWAGNTYDKVLS